MALSSWNALYTHIEQKFMLKRQWRQFHLLKVLCQHADCFGVSYPGPERITALTGIGTEKQINATLEWLVDGEYVRVHEEWNRRKRKWDREFQVSPFAMYIREELQGYAEKVWFSGERDFDFEEVVIKRNGQPSPESESESSTDNHPQNQHHHPPKNAPKEQGQGPVPDYVNRQRRRRKTDADRPTENDAHAGGPPPPAKVDLRRYKSPLPGNQEDRAQDLHTMLSLRIHQARALIANYPADVIEVAKRATLHAMDKGTAIDPPALFTSIVKKSGVSPEDRNIYPTREEKIAAANAAMLSSSD
jgi:hypothetical protein